MILDPQLQKGHNKITNSIKYSLANFQDNRKLSLHRGFQNVLAWSCYLPSLLLYHQLLTNMWDIPETSQITLQNKHSKSWTNKHDTTTPAVQTVWFRQLHSVLRHLPGLQDNSKFSRLRQKNDKVQSVMHSLIST